MTPLNELLQVRDQLIHIYKRYERFIVPVLKFIITISVLGMISNWVGYANPLTKITAILIMSLIGALLSPQLIMLFFIIVTSLHIAAGSLEVGIMVFVIMFLVYLLFIRLYPVESLFIIGMIMAYKFHIPYIMPLIGGLFGSVATIVSLTIGVTIWYCAPQVIAMMEGQGAELSDMVGAINTKLITLKEVLVTDQTLLASIIIMSVVLLTVYMISKQNIDYAEYMAILVGSVMNLIGFLFAIILFRVDVGILGLMVSTVVCALITTIVHFFYKAADYSRAEVLQFEDEKNYYYVKVIPKIIMNKPKVQIQHNYTKDGIKGKNHEN